MKKMTKIVIGIIALAGLVVFSSFRQTKKPWTVPDKFNKMTNPMKADAETLKEGKAIWTKHCQSCHGKSGLGDGSKAPQLKTEPGDFSQAETQKQSDGALFYKVSEGRDDMPSFKKKLEDDDEVWQVITYLRTFKK
jgi:mono/diheme cytochrome c family protein